MREDFCCKIHYLDAVRNRPFFFFSPCFHCYFKRLTLPFTFIFNFRPLLILLNPSTYRLFHYLSPSCSLLPLLSSALLFSPSSPILSSRLSPHSLPSSSLHLSSPSPSPCLSPISLPYSSLSPLSHSCPFLLHNHPRRGCYHSIQQVD